MGELNRALTFPVFYHGLIAGRTLFHQYEIINLIFNGNIKGQDSHDMIAGPQASSISHGKKAIGYNLARPVLSLELHELAKRLRVLRLQNPERVIPEFHAYILKHLSLSEETVRQLKSAYTEADNTNSPYVYIAQVLLCALDYSNRKCPLSKEDTQFLENLGSQQNTGIFPAQNQIESSEADSLDKTGMDLLSEPALSTIVEAMVPRIVHAVLSTIYLRGKNEVQEFEHIKALQMSQAAAELLKSGKMTYSEYYKCGNFLEIAKKADTELQRRPPQQDKSDQFNFDWFLRFFEAAGNISSEDMQFLWGKVLAGEIRNPGNFSLRAIETLRNMTAREALIFKRVSRLILSETDGSKFLFYDTDDDDELNERYGIFSSDILLMDECGLLSSLQIANQVRFYNDGASGFLNANNLILLFQRKKKNVKFFQYKSYPLTQTALQLLPVVQDEVCDDYLLELGRILRVKFDGKVQVTAHRVREIDGDNLDVDDECDLL